MKVSNRVLLAFALVTLTHFTWGRVTGSTNEDGDSDSVSTNGTDPFVNMLDSEIAAAEDRTNAINNNIRTISTVEADRGMKFAASDDDVDDEDEEKKKKKKRKRKGKGRKRSRKGKGKKRRKSKKAKMYPSAAAYKMAEEDKEAWEMNKLPEPEEPIVGNAPEPVVSGSTDPYDYPVNNPPYVNRFSSRNHDFNVAPSMSAMRKYFDVKGLGDYLDKCTDCFEQIDGEENLCPMHSPAMELKKWANELEDVLSHGCAKPENCDQPGACCLARKAPFEPLIVMMTQMLKDVFHMVQRNCKDCGAEGGTPVELTGPKGSNSTFPGGPGLDEPETNCPWSEWSECKKPDCTQIRTRTCGSPPAEGKPCSHGECDRVLNVFCWWTEWGPCSETCGDGRRTRYHNCTNDDPKPEYEACNEMDCPIDTPTVCEEYSWNTWGTWSTCSKTCGQGMKERRRQCRMIMAGRKCGQTCNDYPMSERDTDTSTCEDAPCRPCRQKEWSTWQQWSHCSVSCGEGMQKRSRQCEVTVPGRNCRQKSVCELAGGTESQDRICQQQVCECERVEWASWSSWSSCSKTCDRGQQTRERTCVRQSRGRNCGQNTCGVVGGRDTDSQTCLDKVCNCEVRVWSMWTSYGACTATCGSNAVKRRQRICQVDRPGMDCPSQVQCTENEEEFDEMNCPYVNCLVCAWATWSRWSPCSETCGQGVKQRYRECEGGFGCNGMCPGTGEDQETCQIRSETDPRCRCEEAEWSMWSRWGQCDTGSRECGRGVENRQRTCEKTVNGKKCGRLSCKKIGLKETDDRVCDVVCPCEEASWSTWSQWSQCSRTCGLGSERRSRVCQLTRAGKKCGGLECGRIGSEESDTQDCQTQKCLCERRAWAPWVDSACSVTCGQGLVTRTRRCRVVQLGDQCPEISQCTEREQEKSEISCTKPECCVPPVWSSWGSWSSCPVSCGEGTVRRERFCDRSGNTCRGQCAGNHQFETKVKRCGPPADVGRWSSWGSWSTCSRSCGGGRRMRRRQCSNPRPNACSTGCTGPDTEPDYCNRDPCCEVRAWSVWTSYEPCSVTCGQGMKRRQRTCQVFTPGQDCRDQDCDRSEVDVDNMPCQEKACITCAVKEWTTWETWTPCSATCGQGTRQRYRRCIDVVPGKICATSKCYGDDHMTENCKDRSLDHPDCNTFGYGQWQEWCPCDCTTGERSRRRECNRYDSRGQQQSVDINNCIKLGEARITEKCDVFEVCPGCIVDCVGKVDGNYQSCQSCSHYITCTGGQRKLMQCKHKDTEFDSFIKKCVPAPSPSCSLKVSYDNCNMLPDGKFPSTKGCGNYLDCKNQKTTHQDCNRNSNSRYGYTREYNHHSQTCVDVKLPTNWQSGDQFGSPPGSPTCSRQLITTNHANLHAITTIRNRNTNLHPTNLHHNTGSNANTNIGGNSFNTNLGGNVNRGSRGNWRNDDNLSHRGDSPLTSAGDAPADMYYDEKHGLTPEQRRAEYEREVMETRQRAEKDAKRAKMLKLKEKEMRTNRMDLAPVSSENLSNPLCVTDCESSAAGLYASCRGCRYYVICTKHGKFREKKCPRGKEFDTSIGKCVRDSSSCRQR